VLATSHSVTLLLLAGFAVDQRSNLLLLSQLETNSLPLGRLVANLKHRMNLWGFRALIDRHHIPQAQHVQ